MAKRHGRYLGRISSWLGPSVPMQNDGYLKSRLPEPVARLAYEEYAYQYGRGQSFERLHERGGFSRLEVIGLLADLIERERGVPGDGDHLTEGQEA